MASSGITNKGHSQYSKYLVSK